MTTDITLPAVDVAEVPIGDMQAQRENGGTRAAVFYGAWIVPRVRVLNAHLARSAPDRL